MGIFIMGLWLGLLGASPVQQLPTPEVAVRFVPEMEALPFLVYGAMSQGCEGFALPGEAEWAAWHAAIVKQIDREQIVSLSLWAKSRMEEGYELPAEWTPRELTLAHCSEQGAVLESTLQDLPSHHPLVIRMLKVFILADPETSAPREIVVTIRGERFE